METLGIIGGMGPMATAYLLELIIQMTDAKTDQEHLRTIVFDNPQVPDRTAYILDREKPSPRAGAGGHGPDLGADRLRGAVRPLCHLPLFLSGAFRQRFCALPPHGGGNCPGIAGGRQEKAGILATTGTVMHRVVSTGVGKIWHRVGRALPAGPGAGHVPDLRRHQGRTACQYGEVPAGQRRAV